MQGRSEVEKWVHDASVYYKKTYTSLFVLSKKFTRVLCIIILFPEQSKKLN